MRVGIVGVNHKSCDLKLREMIAKSAAQLKIKDSVLLSTCNRTEMYFSGEDLAEIHGDILSLIRAKVKEPFEHALYSYFGEDCFAHLALVTAGLDSVVLAETEIQRQAKLSYEVAVEEGKLVKELHYLFQKSFKIAKKIRTSFPALKSEISLEGMLLRLSNSFFQTSPKVLFIGNSKVNRQIITFFKKKGITDLFLYTRSLTSEEPFANLDRWHEFDLVICGTKAEEYLINLEDVGNFYKTRLMIDLGVPRNIDPRFRIHPYITLLNIEEIGNLIKKKEEDLEEVKEMIREDIKKSILLFQDKEALCVY